MTTAAFAGLLAGALLLLVTRVRRDRRRTVDLREALHELRRPLQSLILGADPAKPDHALLDQLRVALADLENAVEGRRPSSRRRGCFTAAELLRDAEQRWPGYPVAVSAPGDASATVEGDRIHIGMALDNLIANGLEHGGSGVSVVAREGRRRVHLEVVNGSAGGGSHPAEQRRAGEDGPPRGNGLRIAARHAAADSGRLRRPREQGGRVVAAVELPRTDPRPPAA